MMDDDLKPYFLAADVRLYTPDVSLLIAPSGAMYHIEREPQALRALLARCNGTTTVADLVGDDPTTRDILDALHESGCLTLHPPAPHEAEWQRFADDAESVDGSLIAQTHLVLVGHQSLAQPVLSCRDVRIFASVQFVDEAILPAVLDAHATLDVVLLALYDYEDAAALARLDELCEQHGVRRLSARFAQDMAWLGPAIVPGQTATYRDLLDRRAMAAEDQAMLQALLTPPLAGEQGSSLVLRQPELLWVIAILMTEIQRWIVGAPCRLICAELCVDPLTQQQTSYPVLSHPRRWPAGDFRISAAKDIGVLLNARSGIITDLLELRHHPSIPHVFRTVQARLAQNPDWLNDPLSMSSFCDLSHPANPAATSEAAFQSAFPIGLDEIPPQALLHAAKYYCDSNFYSAQTQLADYNKLISTGDYALDPQRLALFSDTIDAERVVCRSGGGLDAGRCAGERNRELHSPRYDDDLVVQPASVAVDPDLACAC